MGNKKEINKYKKDNEVLEIVRNSKSSSKTLISFFNGSFHYKDYINSLIAKHKNLKLSEQEIILEKGTENEVEILLDNESCDISIKMSALVKYPKSESLKIVLAKNYKTSKEVLNYLFENCKEENVLFNLAKNPNTEEKILLKMANSKKMEMQTALASNTNAPVKILEKFAKSSEESVRILVVRNPNTPSWILQELRAEFEDMVTKHPNYKPTVEALLEGIESYAKTSSGEQ